MIAISSGPARDQIAIIAMGRVTDKRLVRACRAVYQKDSEPAVSGGAGLPAHAPGTISVKRTSWQEIAERWPDGS